MLEKLEECPHCGEVTGWGYDSQMCGNCDYGVPKKNSRAAEDVIAERQRQIWAEGWTLEHDDSHHRGEMALAAACYAIASAEETATEAPPNIRGVLMEFWPWDRGWWKPKDRRRNLVRAGALILAEIERSDRVAERMREAVR